MRINTYKNRHIDYSKPVDFYRCLNRKGFVFSLRQNGLVIGHTDKIVLKDCTMVINKSGKDRCLKTKTRNVHAFVTGLIGNFEDIKNIFTFNLNYNPFETNGFYCSQGPINKCNVLYLQDKKVMIQI